MLLVKLQRKDLLCEHLVKMLGRFQGISDSWVCVVHSLATFPTGRPELIHGCELLAGKLPNNPDKPFWEALPRYCAGKYDELEVAVPSGAVKRRGSLLPDADVDVHAMTKAKLNDLATRPGELLTKAKERHSKRQCLTIRVRPLGTMVRIGGTA